MHASARWSKLVKARLAEMERLDPGRGAVGPSFWNSRARRFARSQPGDTRKDPLYARLVRASGARSTVLDVGAGAGRFALALAPKVGRVVAVDSSEVMVGIITKRARDQGLDNVETVVGAWPAVEVGPADVTICSYVLPLVADAARFLRRLDEVTTGRAFLYLNATSFDLLSDPMWRHFHDKPRKPAPTYLDAVAILAELGIRADVEIVEIPTRSRFATVNAAVKAYRDQLVLPDDAAVRRELRTILSSWLVEDEGGLRPPLRSTPAAIVSWAPRPPKRAGRRPAAAAERTARALKTARAGPSRAD